MQLMVSANADDRGLRLRSKPGMKGRIVTILQVGEMVNTVDSEELVNTNLGSKDHYLQVSTSSGFTGYCPAWMLIDPASTKRQQSGEGGTLLVSVTDQVGTSRLRLRLQPQNIARTLASESSGTILKVLEPPVIAKPRLGIIGQWLKVEDPSGLQGFVSAYYLQEYFPPVIVPPTLDQPHQDTELIPLTDQPVGQPPNPPREVGMDPEFTPLPAPPDRSVESELSPPVETPPADWKVRVSVSVGEHGLRFRSKPDLSAPVVGVLSAGSELELLEPQEPALSRVGVFGQWLQVKDEHDRQGFVAAWFVETNPAFLSPSSPEPALPLSPEPPRSDPVNPVQVTILVQGDLYGNAACSPTCACMLLDYYHTLDPSNRTVTPAELIDMLDPGDGDPGTGMSLSKVTDELESLGYKHISQKVHASLADLRSEVVNGPFIVTVGVKLSGPGMASAGVSRIIQGPGHTLHAMVLKGISENNVVVNDPWSGSELVFSLDAFGSMWKLGLNGMYMIRP
jgi:uncharacterized protein YgiM (DUF1202 family)